ncbi:MAG: divalent-cation tolerance protein CutA [Thermoplasmatales archaeon]|nr:MAG: divalent-cation tolerance protein CutA [Thermoplasmatales archaeon]
MVAVVYTTIDNILDARKIAHNLVEEQLVVCVNIIPKVESIYRWKGKIENSEEYILIAKTTDINVKKTIQKIKKLHGYELPDIIVLPIIGGLKDYLDYIANETL